MEYIRNVEITSNFVKCMPSNGWILLNVRTMLKILCYLIKVSTLLSNIRLSALFRRLEESTQWRPFYVFNKMPDLVLFEKNHSMYMTEIVKLSNYLY